ncbi:putative ATP-dependent RNA helicase DDX28 [Lissotriton helveticus]
MAFVLGLFRERLPVLLNSLLWAGATPCSRQCSSTGPAVIRIPRRMQLRRERALGSGSKKGHYVRPVLSSLPGRLLISSRRPELNQHTGHTFKRLGPPPRLVSKGWKHHLSYGDYFTVNNTTEDVPSLPQSEDSGAPVVGFEELGVSPALVQLLKDKGFLHPTGVQRQTIPRLLGGNNVLCAAETGSGKTLCYLLPILLRLLSDDTSGTSGQDCLSIPTRRTEAVRAKGSLWHEKEGGPDAWPTDEQKEVQGLQDCLERNENHEKTWDSRSLGTPRANVWRRLRMDDGPRSLVVVPSRELADQVYSVATSLSLPFRLKVKSVGGGRGMGRVKKTLSGPADILVATPGALCKALRRDLITLRDLRFLVLDEADTLCDESFKDLVEEILLQVNISTVHADTTGLEGKAQLVVIGATFPKGVGELLGQFTDLGTITTIKSKRLHFLMPHVKQKFLKVKGADKLTELLEMLKKQEPGAGVLVFCNNSKTVNWLGYLLDDHRVKHLRLQGQMPADRRTGIFNSFQKGLTDVLVCTDIASRGLDSTRVELVINYDFPPTLHDYIHRTGRVGRVGSKHLGVVVSFVTHKWDVELVQKIETAARRRTSLPGMESSMKEPIPKTDLIQFDSEEN